MDTYFFNVGHGETILIELYRSMRTRWIIRDFGRSRFAKNTDFSLSIPKLTNHVWCRRYPIDIFRHPHNYVPFVDAVLSHAHEDHFNGFHALYEQGHQNVFGNAYIPMFRMDDLNSLGGVLIKSSVLLYRYHGPDHPIGQNARNWLLATPVLAGLSKNLWCVSAGHVIDDWGYPNRVLWPPARNIDSREYHQMLNWYLDKNSISREELDEDSERIRMQLHSYYSDNVEKSEGRMFNREQVAGCIATIDEVLRMGFEKNNEELSSPDGLYDFVFKPTIDNHSLVFEIGNNDEEYLYLSDADNPTVKLMLEMNKIHDKRYRIIKAGHHGNRGAGALIKHRITADEVINCCGPAKSDWKGPDSKYKSVSDNLICTDWYYNNTKWGNVKDFKIHQSCCIMR